MTDFDYDVMQKKRIAHGARHMKRGSKSKKCSLPSDGMTPAEWKRRNGPVSTYKLDAPMNWSEFKAMPDDLKVKYIRNLRELYGANDKMFAAMFFIHFTHFARVRADLGITEKMPRLSREEAERREAMWTAFCNGVVGGEPSEEIPVAEETAAEEPITEQAPESEPVPVLSENPDFLSPRLMMEHAKEALLEPKSEPKPDPDPLRLENLSATFRGEFKPEKFLKWITQLPMPDGKVSIKVEVDSL